MKISIVLPILYTLLLVGLIRAISLQPDEVEEQLSVLNKPPVTSFKIHRAIFDCIDIYKQPAFDNPLLKNHRIQLKPNHLLSSNKKRYSESEEYEYLGLSSGIKCPNGTVPIRRSTKGDLLRKKSSARPMDYDPFISKAPNVNYAVVKLKKADQPIIAARAGLSLHNLNGLSKGEASGAEIWVYNGDGPELNGNHISAGWTVDEDLYGDDHVHLTASWKGDGDTGCTNLQCSGFMQTMAELPLGWDLGPNLSIPGGPYWFFKFAIAQDVNTKNWWLYVGKDLHPIGYWPKELFGQLGGGAYYVAYGGITWAAPSRPLPPMGTGIASCDPRDTAHVITAEYAFEPDKFITPLWEQTVTHIDCPNSYAVQHDCPIHWTVEGFSFMYGGGGGTC